MKRSVFLCCGLVLCLFPACRWLGVRGNGHIVTQQRLVGDFSELHVGGTFEIEWRNGSPGLTIITDENLVYYVETEVQDNYLRIRLRERVLPTHGLKLVVTSPRRAGAKLTGASRLVARELTGDGFAVETTGAAEVRLDGKVGELLADMTGASELSAKNLQTRTAEVSTTGAASADVSASEKLKVSITGAGEVIYRGNPVVTQHVTGAGKVRRKD